MADDPGATKRCPFCAEEIAAAAVKCKYCKSDLTPPKPSVAGVLGELTEVEKAEMRGRLRRLNGLSFLFGLPGLALQFYGIYVVNRLHAPFSPADASMVRMSSLLQFVGGVLLIIGLVFNARYKGRSGWWGLMGLLSCIGLIVLYFISKHCHHCGQSPSYNAQECANCRAPM